jgi:hypothetical protein
LFHLQHTFFPLSRFFTLNHFLFPSIFNFNFTSIFIFNI